MEIQHLEKSAFRRLKLVDRSTPEGDCNVNIVTGIGDWWDHPYPLRKLFNQFMNLLNTNPRLMAALGGGGGEGGEGDQLLEQPSIVSLIDKFIASYGDDKESVKKQKKDAAASVDYRTRGNRDYGQGQLSQAAYYYTMAIVYAPNVSLEKVGNGNFDDNVDDNVGDKKVPEELSLAYGNRSAVFYELGKYEACLADIGHALATGYPRAKYPKVLTRKVECLIALARLEEAKLVWEQQLSNIPEVETSKMKTDKRLLKIRRRLYGTDIDDDSKVCSNDLSQKKKWHVWIAKQLDICNFFKAICSGLIEPVKRYVSSYPSSPSPSPSTLPPSPSHSPSPSPLPSPSSSTTNQMLPIIDYLARTGRYEPSTKFPPFSAKLEPLTTAKSNRLVANQDIAPGELLVVESPFMSVLNRKFEFHFCHHCCRRLEEKVEGNGSGKELCLIGSSVPCTHCTRVLYCSTDCRTESWRKYHQFECSILPVLYEMTMFGHLALRMLLVTGMMKSWFVIGSYLGQEKCVRMPDFAQPKDVRANYEAVIRLGQLDRECTQHELALFQLVPAVLAQLLMKCGFVHTDVETKLASMNLHIHFGQMYSKSHKISCRISTAINEGGNAMVIGLGIYPYLASAWRHSCDPNSRQTRVNGSMLIYRATKNIPKGTEMTLSLGTSFVGDHRRVRQKFLWNRYCFWCDCEKCVVEGRDGLDGKYFPIGCKDCGSTLTRSSPTSTSFNCSNTSCSTVMSLTTVSQLYSQVEAHMAFLNGVCHNRIIPLNQVAEAYRHLAQLSSIKGMRNYCKLGLIYSILSDLLVATGSRNVAKERQYIERYHEIYESYAGSTDALLMLLVQQVDYYRQEAITAAIGRVNRGRLCYSECYPRTLKRAIEFVRLFTLVDAEHEASAPDLLLEESRHLWETEQKLVEWLKDFEQ